MSDMSIFTGLLRGAQKKAAYVDANVTIYPSEYEIFGLVPFESILCGTPVVVSDDSGCGEIIGGANIGETVPYGQPELLAQSIARVLDHPEESSEKVKRGIVFIKENLGWPKIAADTVAMYSTLNRAG
jgi:glycosyltransferase involved in cell wall biosynthesis